MCEYKGVKRRSALAQAMNFYFFLVHAYTHMYTHAYTHTYTHSTHVCVCKLGALYVCMCVCVCV